MTVYPFFRVNWPYDTNRPLDGGRNTKFQYSAGYLHNPQILKILQSDDEKIGEAWRAGVLWSSEH